MSLKVKSRRLRKNMTKAERILWQQLRSHRLKGIPFRRQHPVANRYILDFYCPQYKLGIEVDGSIHENSDIQANDELRTKILAAKGIRIIRFTNDTIINNIDEVITKLASILKPAQP